MSEFTFKIYVSRVLRRIADRLHVKFEKNKALEMLFLLKIETTDLAVTIILVFSTQQ